jgi:hypothetical protein
MTNKLARKTTTRIAYVALVFGIGSAGIACFEAIGRHTIQVSSLFAAPFFTYVGYRLFITENDRDLATQMLALLAAGIVIDCVLVVISDRRYIAAALISHLLVLAIVLVTRQQIKYSKA